LEKNAKKLTADNEEHLKFIKELKKQCCQLEYDLDKSTKNNLELIETNNALEKVF
jgi:hypothetical protein